ncbi:MAG: winged helix-turn-helix domain-containing protein, partial [Candidatus Wildermuthbacteria bacterium]|nr:winged helix-turn-helix domain-containing protein [Candidatus Wildermuthbacteria bacterium]
NLNPKCEPQLGKRGLYHVLGDQKQNYLNELALFWVLNLSDGNYSLLDISIRSRLKFVQIKNAADALVSAGLLRSIS